MLCNNNVRLFFHNLSCVYISNTENCIFSDANNLVTDGSIGIVMTLGFQLKIHTCLLFMMFG